MRPIFHSLLAFFCWISAVSGQTDYPQDYFRSPLDIPMYLAGNFGEIRSNHFHAGLDIKTESVVGKTVYAVADGYVSRIKISHGGYGKALYITHPNGFTSVYGHLQKFSPEIEAFIRVAQYRKKSFTIELFPGESALKVSKSDVVAFAGNTGGSGGPHLHFEIRDTESEYPLNPLLFGFDIKDDITPIITRIAIYPLDDTSHVNGGNKPVRIGTYGKYGRFTLGIPQPAKVHGRIGFGIETFDRLNGYNNRCGVFSIDLSVDSIRHYYHELEKFSFDESRYINSHVDFYQWKRYSRRVQRSFLQPNNQLQIYKEYKDRGAVTFNDNDAHALAYTIRDAYGNTSTLKFQVQSTSASKSFPAISPDSYTELFPHGKANYFENEFVRVKIPADALYDDLPFRFKKSAAVKKGICPVFHIHDIYSPLHKAMQVSIHLPNLPKKHQKKALIVSLQEDKQFLSAEGGQFEDGWVTVRTRSMGPYTVMLDTIAPTIKGLNISPNKNIAGAETIQIKIHDGLSGIGTYNTYIDGKWVLMEYEHKKNRLTHFLEHRPLEKGKHHLKLEVTDKCGNMRTYEVSFLI